MKLPLLSRLAALVGAGIGLSSLFGPGCTTTDTTAGSGGSGGGPDVVGPGEVCTPPRAEDLTMRFEASAALVPDCEGGGSSCGVTKQVIFVPACTTGASCITRRLHVIVDPDLCPAQAGQAASAVNSPVVVSFTSSDASIVPAPGAGGVGLHHPDFSVDVIGSTKPGKAKITAHLPAAGKDVTASIEVQVLAPGVPACGGTVAPTPLAAGGSVHGKGLLVGATIGLQTGADAPNANAFLWHVDPFQATIECGADAGLVGYTSLGPAITFGPKEMVFKREIPFSIPINPALLPEKARLRHLRVAYSGPGFKKPRTITVADPRLDQIDGQWVLTFKAPRLGTYQAVVQSDAGTNTRKRRITHRAVMGISMGGGGSATFGMRHHDLFDVLAPLGGPVNWTWMLDYIEKNHLGGFRPIPKGTKLADLTLMSLPCTTAAVCKPDETCVGVLPGAPGKCTLMPKAPDPYLHPQTFNNWWYEYPRAGNGGTFDRQSYVQIFRDLALMYGNPNGENLSPGGQNLPAGVPPNDKSQIGDHPAGQCNVWIDPLDCPKDASGNSPDTCPEKTKQQELSNDCPKERCAHPLTLKNYFDDEYNPDGTFPVITVCDGAGQNQALTPYSNTWHADGNGYPLELALAVDYNGNGVRDELEPIIRAGHEPWYDTGVDGVPSIKEAGYDPVQNPDPAGDDYDAQYNPTGTEGDHRLEAGEKFDDVGLDGVASTKQQPLTGYAKDGDGYDVGEGDGKFTVASGLQRFWDRDAYSIARKMVDPAKVPGGELTDEALSRVDVWTDGGMRDLFNFGVDAQHLIGGFAARGRDTAYLTEFTEVNGLDPNQPVNYLPTRVSYDDLPGIVFQRYGHIDPTAKDVDDGSGQHVGTGTEAVKRLQSALYFLGSRWKEAGLTKQQSPSSEKPYPNAPDCEVLGSCTISFTSKAGRVGPVGITLPPGYAHADLQGVRYPVIYMLHGYGQSPEDLEALVALVSNWMNSPQDSSASRLPKAILVYVDGRCRENPQGNPECLRGTFFADSVRPDGAQDEQWWLELMGYIDQHYRTLGESQVDWTE